MTWGSRHATSLNSLAEGVSPNWTHLAEWGEGEDDAAYKKGECGTRHTVGTLNVAATIVNWAGPSQLAIAVFWSFPKGLLVSDYPCQVQLGSATRLGLVPLCLAEQFPVRGRG